MMSDHRKEGARLLSLALRCGERASKQHLSKVKVSDPDSSFHFETESFAFSYWLGVAMLLQDRSCPPCVVGSFARLLNSLATDSDYLEFIDCASEIRSVLVQNGFWKHDLFKGLCNRWLRGLTTAIEHAVDTSLCIHPSRMFRDVVNFLGWLKRLPVFIRPLDQSVRHYRECEERLSSINFDDNVYVPQLREIWLEWFKSFELRDPFLPRHGSGSTADVGKVLQDKWSHLSIDTVADVCFRYPNLEKVLDLPVRDAKRISKVVFVPKQAGKDRTICMEPAWLQFLQQGVASQLVAYTHRNTHPLSRMVNVFNQEVNRTLCARAYADSYATIDLSDASDSVSFELIGRLIKGTPLYRYYYGTRSVTTILDGDMHTMIKFAPMGSALCFINECFVFASVAELAYRIHYGKASRGYQSGISIYGDDIVCPVELYESIVDILSSLGFIINTKKSYSSGGYYESCGVEYLYGALIETIKHPRAHLLQKEKWVSPDLVGTVTDLANSLGTLGYYTARRILLKKFSGYCLKVGNRKYSFMDVVYFSDDGLKPIIDDYTHTRWDSDIQARVSKHFRCTTAPTPGSQDYTHFQWSTILRNRRVLSHGFDLSYHEKWSSKAILFLCKSKQFDLLRTGEVQEVGACKTGRLRTVVRKEWNTTR